MRLVRASEIMKLPVVTLDGEDVAQVKDIVYSGDRGAVIGFTLAGRGLLAGPLQEALPFGSVVSVGRDAVMIADGEELRPVEEALDTTQSGDSAGRGDVLGSTVLTESGVELGAVADVIVSVEGGSSGRCDVVGYEIEPSQALGGKDKLLVPLPDTLAASSEHVIVPASAREFLSEDLEGFSASVEAFRKQLGDRG